MLAATVDGAHDTRATKQLPLETLPLSPRRAKRQAMEADERPSAVARNESLRASKYLGRAIWRRWSGHHRRGRVEAKMNCIKLLGQSLMARDFDRQVAELQVRIAALNG